MLINNFLSVEPIFDYKHGRRFQIIITNPIPGETFTIHKDLLARQYVKIKLTEMDIFALVTELNRNFELMEKDAAFGKKRNHLRLITEKDEG